jgi:hypothetical protein
VDKFDIKARSAKILAIQINQKPLVKQLFKILYVERTDKDIKKILFLLENSKSSLNG